MCTSHCPPQHVKDFEDLVRTVVTLCNPEEQERLREMEDWIVKNEVKRLSSDNFFIPFYVFRAPGFWPRVSTRSWATCCTRPTGRATPGWPCSSCWATVPSRTISSSSSDRTGRTAEGHHQEVHIPLPPRKDPRKNPRKTYRKTSSKTPKKPTMKTTGRPPGRPPGRS